MLPIIISIVIVCPLTEHNSHVHFQRSFINILMNKARICRVKSALLKQTGKIVFYFLHESIILHVCTFANQLS